MTTKERTHPLFRAITLALIFGSAMPVNAQDVDLGSLGTRGFRIDGIGVDGASGTGLADSSGFSVSGAGDVNGDGLADLIVGAPGVDVGAVDAGESYVVFGKADNGNVALADIGTGGFHIVGITTGDLSGTSVSGAGDVNGDGLTDLIIGARRATGNSGDAGESYVVFGKNDNATIDLGNLLGSGFRIDGMEAQDHSGYSVSGAGDVNGDGLADLIIGAPGADTANSDAGKSYVVFGKADSSTVSLDNLGTGGFLLVGGDAGQRSGSSVSGGGDVNGDGLADLIVGALFASSNGNSKAGESCVVFGKSNSTEVDLAALGAGGFCIYGIEAYDISGRSVAGAGDVNGDGLADLIVGAPSDLLGPPPDAGESYVVFGKTSTAAIDLANLGTGGFTILGIEERDAAGRSVSGAGDINGDGLADLIVGAPRQNTYGQTSPGESYVIFGKPDVAAVDLGNLSSSAGFRLAGIDAGDQSGSCVSSAGDLNGDGLADLIIGASGADSGSAFSVGESYVVFSTSVPLTSATVRSHSKNGNAPRTAFGISGDGSNDSTPDVRAWIDFDDGNDTSFAASTEVVTLTRSSGDIPNPGANVSWYLQTSRQNWTSAELKLKYLDSEVINSENNLQIQFSPNGNAPFTSMPSTTRTANNTISAIITQPGYYFIGTAPDLIFANGFD